MATNPLPPMFEKFQELLAANELTDLTIVCGDQELKMHRVLLAASSDVFRKMLTGNFKEATDGSGVIKLDDEVDTLIALIRYLYTNTYDDGSCDDGNNLSFAVRVYPIADFYAIPQLQQLAAESFKAECQTPISETPGQATSDFIDALHLIEERTNQQDSTLRDIVLQTVKKNLKTLLQDEKFRGFLAAHPNVKFQLLSLLADSVGSDLQNPKYATVGDPGFTFSYPNYQNYLPGYYRP